MTQPNILFLCGGLEPGKDGVGDYIRRLADALSAQGVAVAIASLYDAYVLSAVEEESNSKRNAVSVLRLPSGMSWKEKRSILQEYINKCNPRFISLQYVLYGFQPKGLPFRLAGFLKNLKGKHRWHIMFHELWVGKEDGNSFKMLLLAFLQRSIIRNTILALQPHIIHTHLPAYKTTLGALGFTARELPLFSNISQVAPKPSGLLHQTEWQVAFFSQVGLPPGMLQYLNSLQRNLIDAGKKLKIVLLGGTQSKMAGFKNQLRQLETGELSTIELVGFLSPEQLSHRLNQCVLGITPVVENGLGKSGSVAAFIEHELSVGVPHRNNEESAFFNEQLNKVLLYEPTVENIKTSADEVKKAKKLIDVNVIAEKFLHDLTKP